MAALAERLERARPELLHVAAVRINVVTDRGFGYAALALAIRTERLRPKLA